ncbi:ABC transporter permease [Paramaledivibacter caminithermalis]|jgi:peptide/nickel transport system permease protein|uniref:Peptide/nickel transport system permease protein n=1 Tax=Paramaledivibacter caminithermalis (strain DSM 15212 / CIP 107654 / DViRD3) TaxID=1121301 RepID=A0A1M6RGY5_PARC5|nr:ABC transporter permease [Paramaledivibacter caminithermalis]SHK31751.1 peptide/nickel transport system permease protein [Paramaledivibacter caminithermalis DSM 15212]
MNNYRKYFLKKGIWYILTLVIALSLNFYLPRMIKGNPVDSILSKYKSVGNTDTRKKLYETFTKEFGLDKPLPMQFLIYLKNLTKGDLGTSIMMYPKKVNAVLASALPWTVGLQLPAILCGWLLGNVLGAFAAYKRGVYDKIIFPISLFVTSFPFFIFSIILLYVLGIHFELFPIGGGYDYNLIPALNFEFFKSVIRYHTFPFLSIAIVMIGGQGIGMREMALYELNSDYVKYSKFLGIREWKIIQYVFKNAMLPQITGLGLSLGTMVSGALITELVFNYPGVGTTMFAAIRNLDYPLISGCTLIITLAVLLSNFIIEILYGIIDPRIKSAQLEDS